MRRSLIYLSIATIVSLGFSFLKGLDRKESNQVPARKRTIKSQRQLQTHLRHLAFSSETIPISAATKKSGSHITTDLPSDSTSTEPSSDESQNQLIEEVVEEMQQVQEEWRSIRDAAYAEMHLDANMQEQILVARAQIGDIYARLADTKGAMSSEAFASIVRAQKKYDHYVRYVLGEERYEYLRYLRDSFNSDIRQETKHVTRIADDW